MKFVANLIVAASMFVGQFSTPYAPQASAQAPASEVQSSSTTTTTENNKPRETATPTPMGTSTPAPETSTPVPSSTEVPPVETTVPEEPVIAVNLTATPDFVTPGGQVNIDWKIDGVSIAGRELFLNIILPKGFTPNGKELKFDEASQTLSIPVLKENGQFQLQAGEITEDATMLAFLVEKETSLAKTSLVLAAKDQFNINSTGGEVKSSDGLIQLSFPTDTFTDDTIIQIGKPTGDEIPAYSLSGHPFSIKAQDKVSKSSLHRFKNEVEITVSYADLAIPEGNENDLYVYWYNPKTKLWEGTMSFVDTKTKTIRTLTNHFSVFDIGINNWQATHIPTIDAFQVSKFTGAGTFSLPIEVPSGPGGLQPNLSLSYNSQVVDQATFDPTPGKTNSTLASWVGMGWSLDTSYIERDVHGTPEGDSDDTYLLNVAGVSTRIAKGADNKYHAVDENFWKIEFDNPTNTWTVWDKNGNIYYFGDVTGEVVGATSLTTKREDTSWGQFQDYAWRWSLRREKNIFGKELKYTYYEETKTLTANHDTTVTDTAVYPATILYPNGRYQISFEREGRSDYYSEWVSDNIYHQFEQSRLKAVLVQQDADGNGTFETEIRRYEFRYAENEADIIFPSYTFSANAGKMTTLLGVKQYGLNQFTINGESLPEYTFNYKDNTHLTDASNGYGGGVHFTYDNWYPTLNSDALLTNYIIFGSANAPCGGGNTPTTPWVSQSGILACDGEQDNNNHWYYWMVLNGTTYSDGAQHYVDGHNDRQFMRPGRAYKFTVGYEPTSLGGVQVGLNNGISNYFGNSTNSGTATAIIVLPYGSTDLKPVIKTTGSIKKIFTFKVEALPTFSRVATKTVSDGNGHNYTYTYDYANPTDPNHPDTGAMNDTNHSVMSAACAPNDQTCHQYFGDNSEYRGNAFVTEISPDGQKVVTNFSQTDAQKGMVLSEKKLTPSSTAISESVYTYAQAEQATEFGSTDYHLMIYWVTPATTESHIYTSGNSYTGTKSVYDYENTYGSLTSTSEYEINVSTPYRITFTNYITKTDGGVRLVLPSRQQVLSGTGALLAESQMLYDDHTSYNVAPTVGKLTATQQLVNGANYSATSFVYDEWGNRTGVTAYSGYGGPSDATGARTTNVTFDSIYHTYPVSITNPLNQTSLTYDYGLGVPLTESDANDPNPALITEVGNTTIAAQYDSLGRLKKVIRPGNNEQYPTLSIEYSNSYPFTASITQRVDDNNTYTITRVYDGMGRQTKITSGGVSVNTDYTSVTETRQSTPYEGNTPPSTYTRTVADLNARTVTVTAPDNTSTITGTEGLTTRVTDPRGNITRTTADIWGRTASVIPPTGPAIRYVYNPKGNMTYVIRGPETSINSQECITAVVPTTSTCPSSTITAITYTLSGLKASMTDPDMGYWWYQYDALGNLTQQVDAKGQYTCMYYDSLNRLKGKNYLTSTCPADPNTYTMTNSYDAGTNGIGRRTSMTNVSNGSTITNSWAYDARGRVTSETVMGYKTVYEYDSADLMTAMKYPGGSNGTTDETVAYDYNSKMLLEKLHDTKNTPYISDDYYYVTASTFDVAGRLTDRTLGNGEMEKFIYTPWNNAQEGGRLDKIIAGLGAWNANTQTFATTHQKLDYAYDPSGNITQIFNPNISETQTFSYDALDRLTRAQASGVTSGAYQEAYGYNNSTGNLSGKVNESLSLVSWWSMDETSGTRYDSYGSNHLADNNTVTYAAGKKGNAANFVTANLEYLSLADNPSTSGGDVDFTLAGHVYLNSTSSIMVVANKGLKNSNNRDYTLFFDPTTSKFTFKVGNGSTSGSVAAASTATSGQWYTVIAWHDSVANTLNIQVNNGAVSSSSYSLGGIDTSYPLSIGAHSDGTSGLNGRIDEFALYKRVLTSNERSWFYNNGNGRSYAELYDYASNHPHAVSATSNGNSYTYDANGNMTTRHIASGADAGDYTLTYDAENRLTQVNKNGAVLQKFIYDGDGRRVKSETYANGALAETILFIGAHYEVKNNSEITKYYFAGTSRVAVKKYTVPQTMSVEYFLSDHLGSTSMTMDSSGAKVSEMRYKAWGELRYTWTTSQTTTPSYKLMMYTYTGQASYMDDPTTSGVTEGFGLMFYNARWYDPYLNHFTQPDTIVPDPSNSQDYDRYSYVRNNPLKYTDPSGHFTQDEIAEMWGFKNKNDEKFRNLWDKWGKSGFQDVLLNAKLGDIISFKFENDVLVQLMFGQMDDGSLGFWNIDTKEYVSKEYTETFFDNSSSWALFTRDTTQDPKRDDYFEDYTPTAWKKGDRLEVQVLDYYWAGGVDNNPGYVKIKTDLNLNLGLDLGAIIADKISIYKGVPKMSIGWAEWITGTHLASEYGFTDLWQGGYIDKRIPIIHP